MLVGGPATLASCRGALLVDLACFWSLDQKLELVDLRA